MKRAALLLIAVVVVSGCISSITSFSPYCAELTKDFKEEGTDCECRGIDESASGVSEQDATPECRCTCTVNGTEKTFDVLQSR